MRALAGVELLEAAEICRDGHPIDAALFLAWRADPALDADTVAGLDIGRRDRLLLDMRAATFGPRLDLAAACPACAESLDVGLSTQALAIEGPDDATFEALSLIELDGARFRLRPADSRDLAAVASLDDPEEARRVLALRCLEPLDPVEPEILGDRLVDLVAERMAALDPQADLFAALDCPDCGHAWEAPIDIGLVLINEIETAADRLLADIHDLAHAYHWSEAEILALPTHRRRTYLQLVRS